MILGRALQRVDLATGHVTGSLDVGYKPCELAFSPDDRTLWVSVDGNDDTKNGSLLEIDSTRLRIERKMTLGPAPAGVMVPWTAKPCTP